MIRTKLPKNSKSQSFCNLIEFFLKQDSPSELISLYYMYCYLAIQQNSNYPEINSTKMARLLQWDRRRVKSVTARLIDLKIIQGGGGICPISVPNDSVIYNITSSISKGCTLQETSSPNKRITASMFDQFWSIYPRKTDKGKALSKWLQVCKRKDAPTWREVKRAILQQKQSERWQESMFIPMPATWLNQRRWLDDPSEMKKIDFNQPVSGPAFIIDDGRRYDRCKDGEYRNAAGEIYIP